MEVDIVSEDSGKWKRFIYSAYKKYVKKNKPFFFFPRRENRVRGVAGGNWQRNNSVMEMISGPPSCLITGSISRFLQHASCDTTLWKAIILHCNKNKQKKYACHHKKATLNLLSRIIQQRISCHERQSRRINNYFAIFPSNVVFWKVYPMC